MKIAILRERASGEDRVACVPEMVKKFAALGATVFVETGAGQSAAVPDADYGAAGRRAWRGERRACRRRPRAGGGRARSGLAGGGEAGRTGDGAVRSLCEARRVEAYAAAGSEALSLEFLPRITRAQAMDVLSSQSNLAGYKAVIDAAGLYGRAFPMMTTAAGTVRAAQVLVMGVGVAGLQAIATAKRLGAQVSATDVRSATAGADPVAGCQAALRPPA